MEQIDGTQLTVGRAPFRQKYEALLAANPRVQIHATRRIVSGPYVIDYQRLAGLARGNVVEVIAINEVRAGEIVRVTFIPPAASTDVDAVAGRLSAALDDRNAKAFGNLLHPGVIVAPFDKSSDPIEGRSAVRRRYDQVFLDNPNMLRVVLNRMTLGRFVIDHELLTGLSREGTAIRRVVIWEIENDLIRRVWTLPSETW